MAWAVLLAGIVNVAYYQLNVSTLWLHPHYFADILPQSMANGPAFGFRDFADMFQMRSVSEFRARFLNYLFLAFDHKVRFWLLQHVLIPPQFSPVIWLSVVVVSPVFLFLAVRNLAQSSLAALVAAGTFLLSIGYTSQLANLFMAAKPAAMASYCIMLWLATVLFQRGGNEGRMFTACCGWAKWLLLAMLFFTFFIDEVALFGFAIVGVMFPERFVAGWLAMVRAVSESPRITARGGAWLSRQWVWLKATVAAAFAPLVAGGNLKITGLNVGLLLIPFLLILLSLATIVPYLTWTLHAWDFSFFSFNVNLKNDINFGGEFPPETDVTLLFILSNVIGNLIKVLEMSFLPWPALSLVGIAPGQALYSLGTPPLPVLGLVLLFVVTVVLVLLRQGPPSGTSRDRLPHAIALALVYFAFITVLQIKHVPTIAGYNYGAQYCFAFALVLGLAFPRAMQAARRLKGAYVALIVLFVAANVGNFPFLHKNWDDFHRGWTLGRVNQGEAGQPQFKTQEGTVQYNISLDMDRPTSYRELREIWQAWQAGQLDSYLADHAISPNSVSLVFELRIGEASKQQPTDRRNCWILNMHTSCSPQWKG